MMPGSAVGTDARGGGRQSHLTLQLRRARGHSRVGAAAAGDCAGTYRGDQQQGVAPTNGAGAFGNPLLQRPHRSPPGQAPVRSAALYRPPSTVTSRTLPHLPTAEHEAHSCRRGLSEPGSYGVHQPAARISWAVLDSDGVAACCIDSAPKYRRSVTAHSSSCSSKMAPDEESQAILLLMVTI